jgi:hypothetical protein
VQLDLFEFLGRQLRRLAKHRVTDANLSDVVQECAKP